MRSRLRCRPRNAAAVVSAAASSAPTRSACLASSSPAGVRRAPLLIVSATGGGKTYLASALGIAACHNEHTVTYLRMDDLARRLVLARTDAIAHQQMLNQLSNVDLLVIDDFLTIGIDSDAAADLFAILANREHRLPTMIASQTGPAHWVADLPDRVAADSIVNRLANRARTITLGDVDMRKLRHDQTRANTTYWE